MATRELKDALEQASTTEYGVAKLAAHAGTTAGTVVQADDARLTAAADLATHEAATAAHGATGAVVGTTNSQTLTNKTLTSPVINTPTGIAKGDVGLGNVDNTSDATKDAAAVTLTNKTLTTPTIGSFANAHHSHQDSAGGATLDAAAVASGVLAIARLATGTPDGTKFVRDDGTLAVPSGSGLSNPMTTAADLIVGGASGTPARLAKGTDGQVLTVDPTTHLLVWATPSGGGSALTVEEVDASPTDSAVTKIVFPNTTLGIASHVATYTPAATVSRGADASRPAAGTAGKVYLPTDGFAAYEDSGSTWAAFGPLFPLTTPVDGDFSWVNQGSATVAAQNSGIHLGCTSSDGGWSVKARVKTAPATPYTITALLVASQPFAGIFVCGLCFRQSSDGKLQLFHFYNSNPPVLDAIKFNSPTSAGASYGGGSNPYLGLLSPLWMRLADDGSNRIWSLSGDGQNFYSLGSIGRTDFLTANQVGFFIAPFGAKGGVTLLSWKES